MGRQEALKAKATMWEEATAYFKKKFGKKFKGMTAGIFRRAFRSSMYTRHQGPQECARRLRQIEAGTLQRF